MRKISQDMMCIGCRQIAALAFVGLGAAGCAVASDPQAIAEPRWRQSDAGDRHDGSGLPHLDGQTRQVADASQRADAAGAPVDAQAEQLPMWFAFWVQSRKQVQDPSPLGDDWQTNRTTTLGLVKIGWQGQQGLASLHTCAVASNPMFGTKMTYPSAFVAALAQQAAPVSVVGNLWTFGPATQRVGLHEGHDGPMPATGQASHPAVTDADGDGKPGVTVGIDVPILGKQSLFVAQRSTVQWSANLTSDGVLTATPIASHEQATLGATSSLLVVGETAKPVTDEPPMELRWQQVPPLTSCAQLLADPKGLVGRAWPP